MLDNTVSVALGYFTYCYNTRILEEVVPPPGSYLADGGSLVQIIPQPNDTTVPTFTGLFTSPEDWIINAMNYLLGFDVPETALTFLEQNNDNPFNGSVGLYFFSRRAGIPFFSDPCDRDQDLRCLLGFGLPKGLLYGTILTVAVAVVVWILFPSVAGILNAILLLLFFGGVSGFWIYSVSAFSWGYSVKCVTAPSSLILGVIFPFVPILPALPECAGDEVSSLLNSVFRPCYFDLFGPGSTLDGNTCPTCPNKLDFPDCQSMGFSNLISVVGYNFVQWFPNVSSFLNGTCLVRGNCFAFFSPDAPQMNGVLQFLVPTLPLYNTTQSSIDMCTYITAPVFYTVTPILVLVGIILLVFLVIVAVAAIKIVIALFGVYPLNMLFVDDPEDQLYSDDGAFGTFIGNPFLIGNQFTMDNMVWMGNMVRNRESNPFSSYHPLGPQKRNRRRKSETLFGKRYKDE